MMSTARISILIATGWSLFGCALFAEGGQAKPSGPLAASFVVDSTEVGTLTIVEEFGAVVVDAHIQAPWSIAGARVYAGPEPLPVTSVGAPRLESFPYAVDLLEPVSDYSLELPLSAVGGGCGEPLTAAVQLSLVAQTAEGERSRVVWAHAQDARPGLVFTPRCEPDSVLSSTAVADADAFYEEISDEFVDDTVRRHSVAER